MSETNTTFKLMRDIRLSLVNKSVPITSSTLYEDWPQIIDNIKEKSVEELNQFNYRYYDEPLSSDIPKFNPVTFENYNGDYGPGFALKNSLSIPKDKKNGPQSSCDFSQDMTLFGFTSKFSEQHGIFIYSISGESYSLFQQIPSSVISGVSFLYAFFRFSVDKKFFVASTTAGVFLFRANDVTGLYEIIPTPLATSTASVLFSPDGKHLLLRTNAAPNLRMFNITGEVFTQVSFTSIFNSFTCAEFSHDSEYLYMGHDSSNVNTHVQRIYKRSNGLYTLYLSKTAGDGVFSGTDVFACAWMKSTGSTASDYLAVSVDGQNGYIHLYSINNGVFTRITNFFPTLSTINYPTLSPMRYGGTRNVNGVDEFTLYIFGDYINTGNNPIRLTFTTSALIHKGPIVGGNYVEQRDVRVSSDFKYIAISLEDYSQDDDNGANPDVPSIYCMEPRSEIKQSTNSLSDICGCDAYGYLENKYNDGLQLSGDMVTIYSKDWDGGVN